MATRALNLPWLAWLVAVTGCGTDVDVVARSAGDYDPNAPLVQLSLGGKLDAHNPFLFFAEGRYHVYYSGLGLLTLDSDDGLTFAAGESVFASNPAWISVLLPDVTALWSPSVVYHGGAYHLYYAASVFAENRSCIGHASRTTMATGTWLDRGYVVCTGLGEVEDNYNAIDPSPFVDDDGRLYLTFGSYQTGIKLLALDELGLDRGEPLVTLATRSASNPAIQSPSLMKRGDYYYLFASFDRCCLGIDSTYSIRVGRSTSREGPYIDRDGIALLEDGGTLLLEGNDRFKGPGSSEFFTNGSSRYLVYHAYDVQFAGRVTLRISELRFDNEGWPVVSGP